MRHTFRAQTLQKAMLQVAQNLGPDATVIRTAEVRVPHHDKPVGFEVTAEGIWQADEMEPAQPARTTPESDEENPNPIAPVELAKHPEFSTLNLEDCVEEIMVQLLDVVHQMNGIRKVHTHWSETRTLLEEAQREVERITSIWETTFSSGFPQAVRPAEALSAQPLWNRSERTVAALIGPSGSGKPRRPCELQIWRFETELRPESFSGNLRENLTLVSMH